MNRKGQAIFVGFMIAVVVIIVALAMAWPVKESIITARAPSTETSIGLNCTSPLISTYDEATCLLVDLSLPYFIGGLILIGGAIATAKLLYEA